MVLFVIHFHSMSKNSINILQNIFCVRGERWFRFGVRKHKVSCCLVLTLGSVTLMSWLHKHTYARSIPVQKPRFTFCSLPVSLPSLHRNILFHTLLIKSPESRRVHSVLVRYTALYRTSPPIKSFCLICSLERIENEMSWKFHRCRLLALAVELLWSECKSASLESLR